MPTYEFECRNCHEHIEVKASFTSSPISTCPACGSTELKKIFGNVGIVLKGSGFYRTDSRNSNSSKSSTNGSNTSGEKKDLKETNSPKLESASANGNVSTAGQKQVTGST